jgi:hypothetical protein
MYIVVVVPHKISLVNSFSTFDSEARLSYAGEISTIRLARVDVESGMKLACLKRLTKVHL